MYVVLDGERVRELCEEEGMSRRELAATAGISPTTLRRVEHNRGPVTRRETESDRTGGFTPASLEL